MGHSRGLFFVLSLLSTVIIQYKFCRWLYSNCGRLESEATAQPTEPQPRPNLVFLMQKYFICARWHWDQAHDLQSWLQQKMNIWCFTFSFLWSFLVYFVLFKQIYIRTNAVVGHGRIPTRITAAPRRLPFWPLPWPQPPRPVHFTLSLPSTSFKFSKTISLDVPIRRQWYLILKSYDR